jgi:peroxiredoxin Q/BCP
MIRAFAIGLLLACSAVVPGGMLAQSTSVAGSEAPDFTLKSQDGTPVNLKDFRGQWVVLYFYPVDFGVACSIEAQNFQRDLEQYRKQNAIILGVSTNDVASHQRFAAKEGLTFKLLADSDHRVSSLYGSLLNQTNYIARRTFLIDPQGHIAKVFASVVADGHSEEVLGVLAALQTGGAAAK